ncbi:DUF4259 domain-containing protein [Streptomyces sp. NPDC046931]|uniref:DUF4259 domain-containing protein n=1 Tax=Streptomyces sp. NPDC046931 TaxID=3154806 RepID=UPI0033DCFED5
MRSTPSPTPQPGWAAQGLPTRAGGGPWGSVALLGEGRQFAIHGALVLHRLVAGPARALAARHDDSPIVIDPDDGPREPLSKLPASLRASARLALDRVLQGGSEMAIGWVDSADADQWRQEVRQILQALETPTDH